MTELHTDPVLLRALSDSAKRKLTESELQAQRISFIMGTLDEDSTVTRDQVSRVLAEQSGEAV